MSAKLLAFALPPVQVKGGDTFLPSHVNCFGIALPDLNVVLVNCMRCFPGGRGIAPCATARLRAKNQPIAESREKQN